MAITKLGLMGSVAHDTSGASVSSWPGVLPITHGLPQIVYNGKTINFPKDGYRIQPEAPKSVLDNETASGIVETLTVRATSTFEIAFRNFANADSTDAALKRNLQQFYQWVQAGRVFYFARDRGEVILTRLDGAVNAGMSVVTLVSTDYIQPGATYVIRTRTKMDIVKILTVDSATQVTLVESLDNDYADGDRFRSEEYWPARLANTRRNPIREVPPLHFDVELIFREDVNNI